MTKRKGTLLLFQVLTLFSTFCWGTPSRIANYFVDRGAALLLDLPEQDLVFTEPDLWGISQAFVGRQKVAVITLSNDYLTYFHTFPRLENLNEAEIRAKLLDPIPREQFIEIAKRFIQLAWPDVEKANINVDGVGINHDFPHNVSISLVSKPANGFDVKADVWFHPWSPKVAGFSRTSIVMVPGGRYKISRDKALEIARKKVREMKGGVFEESTLDCFFHTEKEKAYWEIYLGSGQDKFRDVIIPKEWVYFIIDAQTGGIKSNKWIDVNALVEKTNAVFSSLYHHESWEREHFADQQPACDNMGGVVWRESQELKGFPWWVAKIGDIYNNNVLKIWDGKSLTWFAHNFESSYRYVLLRANKLFYDNASGLGILNLRTGKERDISCGSHYGIRNLAVNPSGSIVYYSRNRYPLGTVLYQRRIDQGKASPIILATIKNFKNFTVSPDDRILAYTQSIQNKAGKQETDILRLFDLATKRVVKSWDLPPNVGRLSWSPEGREILIDATPLPYMLNLESGRSSPVLLDEVLKILRPREWVFGRNGDTLLFIGNIDKRNVRRWPYWYDRKSHRVVPICEPNQEIVPHRWESGRNALDTAINGQIALYREYLKKHRDG